MITIDGRPVRVVDAHVHIFPEDLTGEREIWLQRDHWFRELYENPSSRLATCEELIASMDDAGVDHSIVCGFPWSDVSHCRYHNEYLVASVQAHPERLSWLGITVPGEGDAIAAEECFERGAVGLGEFNADAQGFRWTDPKAFSRIAECAAQFSRPVMVHASEPVGHTYPGKGVATPAEITALATSFPNLKIVAAHWGGGLPFYELMPSARATLANVAYDSAATTYLYDHRVFGLAMECAGTNKVLFASDYPVLGQKRLLARMGSVNWASPDAVDLVMHGNAERIYGLEQDQ